MPEPLLYANRARVVLGALKGVKRIDAETLIHLVKREGLPKHDDPFGTGRWCFYESEILVWFRARLAGQSLPIRGAGRPRGSQTKKEVAPTTSPYLTPADTGLH
jgi:hypothetical protein